MGLVVVAVAILGYLHLHSSNKDLSTVASSSSIQATPTNLQCAEKLSTSVLVGQVLMIGLTAKELPSQTAIFSQYHVGGAVVMSSPANPYDGSIKAFKSYGHSVPVLIATDEEGGIVQRFRTLGVLPAPQTVASTFSSKSAEQLIGQHAAKLRSVGIDMVLGPLADVAPTSGTGALGNRVFSSDPQTVSQYDLAYIKGWHSAGLLATLKHFPGMGSATGNTDFQPATTPPLNSLQQRDFVPYQALAGQTVAVMVGNQNVPGWFDGPASLSPSVDEYLRNTLGYKSNLVVTDSLAATAITSQTSVPSAVVDAIKAGNDMAIIVSTDPADITPQSNRHYISQSESALMRALNGGVISKKQLATSVTRKLAAQHISACSVSASDF